MTEIVLTELHEMQSNTVEHKLPNWNGNISFFIEAAGDIYRELCHNPADIGGYIGEKRRKLKSFSELNASDKKEIRDTLKKYSDWYEELENYMLIVDDLSSATEKFQFGVYEKVNIYGTETYLNRKEIMLAALEIILGICIYAEGEFTNTNVEKAIKNFDEMFDKK
jgi:hypothetical protein